MDNFIFFLLNDLSRVIRDSPLLSLFGPNDNMSACKSS